MKYSFVIPVYNGEKTIQNCIESIMKLNLSKEILLIDDGSKDSSPEIIDELAKKYDGIYAYHKENGGAASARNEGIRRAMGEYIVFIDDDDTIENLNPYDIHADLVIYGMSFDYLRNGRLLKSESMSIALKGEVLKNELLNSPKEAFYDNALSSACNKIFKRKIIEDNGLFFDESLCIYEDLDFVLRYLLYADSLYFTGEVSYHYNIEESEKHHNARLKNMDGIMKSMELILENAAMHKIKQFDILMQNVYVEMFMMCLMNNDMDNETLSHLKEEYIKGRFFDESLLLDDTKKLLLSGDERTVLEMIIQRKKKEKRRRVIKRLIGR